MAEGYIKLYRNLLENPVTSKPEMAWLWCVLLLSANHKDVKMIWNGESITIKAGQMITGRKQLSRITGLSESFIYRALKYFESEQQIEQQKNNKFTLITILNWEKYQGNGTTNEQQIEQQMNNQRTTSEQPVNTNKKEKKEKKEIYIKEIMEYLNEKAKTNFKHNIKKNQEVINARIKEGFTVDDFKKVIDIKVSKWKGTQWEEYLRPLTLFGTKFESYLNEKPKKEIGGKKIEKL